MILLVLLLVIISAFFLRAYLSGSRYRRALILSGSAHPGPETRGESRGPGGKALETARALTASPRGRILSAAGCSLTLAILTGNPLLSLLPWPALWMARRLYSRRRKEALRHKKEEQVLELIDSLSQSLRSGLSLQQSLQTSLEDVGAEMRLEIQRILDDFRTIGSLDESLLRAAETADIPALRLVFLVTGLLHAKGGDIPRILDRLRRRISESIELRRELRSLTAQSRASGYLVSSLPAAFLALQALLNPRSLHPLLSSSTGNLILLAALSLNAAAFLLIRKLLGQEA